MGRIIEIENDEPPVRWQCVLCEAPLGTPHAEGCHCSLVEGITIEDDNNDDNKQQPVAMPVA